MAGTTPVCYNCGRPIIGEVVWGAGADVYHAECTSPGELRTMTDNRTECESCPWYQASQEALASALERLAAAEKVVEAAWQVTDSYARAIDKRPSWHSPKWKDLKESLVAYKHQVDGRFSGNKKSFFIQPNFSPPTRRRPMDVEKRAWPIAEQYGDSGHLDELTDAIAALVREAVAEEREQCAETAEANRAQDVIVMPERYAVCVNCSLQIAQAIRARKP